MSSYAGQKGRASSQARPAAPAAPKPITREEEERIAANKQLILEHMPDLLPKIRELHAEGAIDGWRSLVRCTLLDEAGNE